MPVPKKRSPAPATGATYSKYSGRMKCSDCVQKVYEDLQAGRPSGLLIRQARVRRAAGGNDVLLCHAHFQHRREVEAVSNRGK